MDKTDGQQVAQAAPSVHPTLSHLHPAYTVAKLWLRTARSCVLITAPASLTWLSGSARLALPHVVLVLL
ncbi:MAG: hypothetical protein AAFO79_08605 [Pseudomonadota bacterium]